VKIREKGAVGEKAEGFQFLSRSEKPQEAGDIARGVAGGRARRHQVK